MSGADFGLTAPALGAVAEGQLSTQLCRFRVPSRESALGTPSAASRRAPNVSIAPITDLHALTSYRLSSDPKPNQASMGLGSKVRLAVHSAGNPSR